MYALRQTARIGFVLFFFVGIPAAIAMFAAPRIHALPVGEGARTLMQTLVLASIAFGGTSAWMVWRDSQH